MIMEKDLEDMICKYPELIEEGLTFKGRQINLFGKIMDILFEDRFKQRLIIELKKGVITREHVGQVMDYVGRILHEEGSTVRAMLVGSRVPPAFQKSMDYYGVEWKELNPSQLKEFMAGKNNKEFLKLFDDMESAPTDQAATQETIAVRNRPEQLNKREPGWRSRENRKIGSGSRGGKLLLQYLMNKGDPANMNEIAAHMHSIGFTSRTFYNWADGLVATGLAKEVTKDSKRAYVIKSE